MHKHAHNHAHTHSHTRPHGRKLLWVTLLNAAITVTEIVGGLLSNSLSLLSDAVHNLGDTLALVFAYIAQKIGSKKANTRHTFGYKRAEIITAFLNALILIAICLFLFKEAYERYLHPEPIKGKLMLIVAVVGLIANLVSVLVLQKEKEHNINTKAAYLHLLGDTLSSVAVIVGGIAIWIYNIVWIDPLITVLVSIYIIYHTWSVLKEAIDILMQSAPKGFNIEEIKTEIELLPEIKDIHHLHLWQLHENQVHFEAHINTRENIDLKQIMQIRKQIEGILAKHNISHTTLQFGYDCCDNKASLIVEESEQINSK